ncbi:MAG: hypothetical protein HQK52_06940 [Oligoflexia bacterium]|nr:hypothetical protein [Oligoflexia bacterium]
MNKNLKIILSTILLGFVAVSIAFAVFNETKKENPTETKKLSPTSKHQYIAYYFHGNARCQSCFKIESYTAETIKTKFASELNDSKLLWQVVNIEEMANEHFIKEYSLSTKSVVLSEVNEGKEVKWKNLDKIWNLLNDQLQFSTYIENEVRNFLTASK